MSQSVFTFWTRLPVKGFALAGFRILAAIEGLIWLTLGAVVPIVLLVVPLPFVASYTGRRHPLRGMFLVLAPAVAYLVLWLRFLIDPGPNTDVAATVPLTLALTLPAAGAAIFAILMWGIARASRDIARR